MRGTDLQAVATVGHQQALANDATLAAIQAGLPASTTIGSAAFVSGVLAAVGFGAKWTLAKRCTELREIANNLAASFQVQADSAGAVGTNEAPESLSSAVFTNQAMLQQLGADMQQLAGDASQLGSAAELAAEPAATVVDVGEEVGENLSGLASAVSWWSKYGTYVIVGVLLVAVWAFVWGPGKALLARYTK